MFICSDPQFVYVSFTKSGSSSMYKLLRKHFQGMERPRHNRVIPEEFKSYPSFCVVRNPYARMVSWWWSICKAATGDRYGHKRELKQMKLPETLAGFLKLWKTKNDGHPQYKSFDLNGGFNHILKIENIEADFNALPFVTTHMSVPKTNVKNHPHWGELLDPESGKLINRIYKRDFEVFDYEMMEF